MGFPLQWKMNTFSHLEVTHSLNERWCSDRNCRVLKALLFWEKLLGFKLLQTRSDDVRSSDSSLFLFSCSEERRNTAGLLRNRVCVCVRVRQTFSYFNLWKHETTEDLINVETHTGTIASTAHRKLELCSLSSGWQADFITNLLMKEQWFPLNSENNLFFYISCVSVPGITLLVFLCSFVMKLSEFVAC